MKLKYSVDGMNVLGSLVLSAALTSCSDNISSNTTEVAMGDASLGQEQSADSGNNSDLPTLPPTLGLFVSASRVLPDRTFAVIGVVRADARQALEANIQLSVTGNASLVDGSTMKTICTGNGSVGSFIETGNVLIPTGVDSQVGRVVLSPTSSCPDGYQNSGMKISLVHTQSDQPDANQIIVVTGRATLGNTMLTSSANAQLTRLNEPGTGPGLAFEHNVAAWARPVVGQNMSVVVFPRSTFDYGLPCMPHEPISGIGTDAIAGCTVATNGGRSVPPNESITINQPMPVGTAGALTIGHEVNNVAIFARGLQGATPVGFTHLGGGAYIFTMRVLSTPGEGMWSMKLYNHTGGLIDTVFQRVTIAQP